jgi:hypothetical protein
MLEVEGVGQGLLACPRFFIVSEIISPTRSIPAIRSLGVGGWGFFDRSVSICWLVETVLPSMTRQVAGVVDVTGIEPKQMSTGLARRSAMLSGKVTPLVEAIELHEEP